MGDRYVFYFQDKERKQLHPWSVNPDYTNPESPRFKEFQENMKWWTDQFGEPVKVDEPDAKIPYPKMIPGSPMPMPSGGTGIINVPAETFRGITDLAGTAIPGEAGAAGGMALGAATGPLAPVAIPILGFTGSYLGGKYGAKGAKELQKAAGVIPSELDPESAGITEGTFGMLGGAFEGAAKKGARRFFGGEGADIATMQKRARALSHIGVDRPSLPMLTGNVNWTTTMQQLAADLPILKGRVIPWLQSVYDDVSKNLARTIERTGTRSSAAGEMTSYALKEGRRVWREQGGKMFDDFYGMFPKGGQTEISIEPIIDALVSSDTVRNEVIQKMSGTRTAKILESMTDKYGKFTGVYGPRGQKYVFKDVPLEEVHEIRKTIGELYTRVDDEVIKKRIAHERDRIFAASDKAIEDAAPGPDAVKAWRDAKQFWSDNQTMDEKFIHRLYNVADPADIMSKINRGTKEHAREIEAIKKRVLADPDLGEYAWNRVQQETMARNMFTNGQLDLGKFSSWYNGMEEDVRRVMFSPEYRHYLEDTMVLVDSFLPVMRKQGPTFTSQQFERPFKVGSELRPGIFGSVGAGSAMGAGAAVNPAAGAFTGALFMLSPMATQTLITSKKFLKWLTTSSVASIDDVGTQIGLLSGSLFNSMNTDEQHALYQYVQNLQNMMGMAENMNQQTGGMPPITLGKPGAGIISGG